MTKESIVEIPPGSGNQYRYAYEDGKTVYLGPVGDAPTLVEENFLRELEDLITTPKVTRSDIKKDARALDAPEKVKEDWMNILNADKIIRQSMWDKPTHWFKDGQTDMDIIPDDWKFGPGETKSFIAEYYINEDDRSHLEGSVTVVGIYKEMEEFDGSISEAVDQGAFDVQGYLVYPADSINDTDKVGKSLAFPVTKLKIARWWVDNNWPEVGEGRKSKRRSFPR
jgi:hypothetical protein